MMSLPIFSGEFMRRRRTTAGLLLAAVGWPSLTRAASVPQAVRLAIGEWPPYFSQTMRHQGVFAHIVSQAFRSEGLTVEYLSVPWQRALMMVESGAVHGSPEWLHTEERARLYLYTDPVITSREVVFSLRSRPLQFEQIAQLAGKHLGGAIGYNYGEAVTKAEREGLLQIERVAQDETNLRKLLGRRLDGVLLNQDVGLDLLRQKFSPAEAALVQVSEVAVAEKPSHMVMSRALPEVPSLILAFNQGLARLRRDGSLQQMLDAAARGAYRATSGS
jgi:polar amino acid transport system substrate-binding protein